MQGGERGGGLHVGGGWGGEVHRFLRLHSPDSLQLRGICVRWPPLRIPHPACPVSLIECSSPEMTS